MSDLIDSAERTQARTLAWVSVVLTGLSAPYGLWEFVHIWGFNLHLAMIGRGLTPWGTTALWLHVLGAVGAAVTAVALRRQPEWVVRGLAMCAISGLAVCAVQLERYVPENWFVGPADTWWQTWRIWGRAELLWMISGGFATFTALRYRRTFKSLVAELAAGGTPDF